MSRFLSDSDFLESDEDDDYSDLENTGDDEEIFIEKIVFPLKKKGRPQSEHYVDETELRFQIELAQNNKIATLKKISTDWDMKIDNLSTEPEKLAMQKEKDHALFVAANQRSYCSSRLGEIIVITVDKIATQPKYRHYTYLDDMKAEAIYQSVKGITKFDLTKMQQKEPDKKSSSFSYLTQIINNAFRQILKKEKKNREIRDQAIEQVIDGYDDIDTDFESIKRKRERMDGYVN